MECCFLQLAETKGPTISPGATDEALTSGEVPVVRRIAEGNGSKQIADWLPITEGTVKGRVKNILSKLGANDRTYAAMIGPKRGIIEFRFTRKSVNATLFGLPSAP